MKLSSSPSPPETGSSSSGLRSSKERERLEKVTSRSSSVSLELSLFLPTLEQAIKTVLAHLS